MGWFDRFFKRNNDDSAPKRSVEGSISLGEFVKFQAEVRQSVSELRTQFTKVVKENEALRNQLSHFGNRLDQIHGEQMKMGQETRHEIGKIMTIAEKVSASQKNGTLNPETASALVSAVSGARERLQPGDAGKTKATSAAAAQSLVGRLSNSQATGDPKLKPS
jgi:regulator of replication initiation timing